MNMLEDLLLVEFRQNLLSCCEENQKPGQPFWITAGHQKHNKRPKWAYNAVWSGRETSANRSTWQNFDLILPVLDPPLCRSCQNSQTCSKQLVLHPYQVPLTSNKMFQSKRLIQPTKHAKWHINSWKFNIYSNLHYKHSFFYKYVNFTNQCK